MAQAGINCLRHTLTAWRRSFFVAAVLGRRGVAQGMRANITNLKIQEY